MSVACGVAGIRGKRTEDYWIKLEGAKPVGYRAISIAGIRCPTMISRIDKILDDVRRYTHERLPDSSLRIVFRRYGIDGVMRELEPEKAPSHELRLIIEATADTQKVAHDACAILDAKLGHWSYEGQKNTSGNIAWLWSPRIHDIVLQYEFAAYHLMKVESALECFLVVMEEV